MDIEGTPEFGNLLRGHRDALALTQEELAERAGLTPQGIGLLERGERRRPHRYTVHRLADALGLTGEDRARFEASARRSQGRGGERDQGHAPPLRGSLPLPPTPLVGREREVATVARLLRLPHVHLLTLTGAGGAGKSRLGLAVAERLLPALADGVRYVPLVALRDPALVPSALAGALGLGQVAGESMLGSVVEALRDRESLLLLDNFEHLLDGAPLVAELLAACPGLTILVTSRAPLRVRGEHQFPVPPLPVPPAGAAEEGPAGELFRQRALAASPAFEWSAANAAAAREICRRVDGLPLAIELAAARVTLLPPPELLERLSRRPDASWDLLAGGARDLPAHQRTLRETIAWSYGLLGAPDRALFRRLAVFAGGCTLDAAEHVCGGDGEEAAGVVGGLAALVDHSLLHLSGETSDHRAGAGEPRFAMLETVREYAAELLASSGEAETLRRRHAEYVARLAESAQMVGPHQADWLARLEDDLGNLRAALAWAERAGDAETGLRLMVAAWRFWIVRGYLSEGDDWLERMLALEAAGTVRHELLRAKVLWTTGLFAEEQREYPRAALRYDEALGLYRRLGDDVGVAAALAHLGIVAQARGELGRAEALIEESLALSRGIDDPNGLGMVLTQLALVVRARGDHARAEGLLDESLGVFRRMGHDWGVARSLTMLGESASARGDQARAAALFGEGLALHRTVGAKEGIAACLEGLAAVACVGGEPVRAARLGGAAAAVREEIGRPRPSGVRTEQERVLVAAREHLGERTYATAWAAGRALDPEEAIEEALGASPAPAPSR